MLLTRLLVVTVACAGILLLAVLFLGDALNRHPMVQLLAVAAPEKLVKGENAEVFAGLRVPSGRFIVVLSECTALHCRSLQELPLVGPGTYWRGVGFVASPPSRGRLELSVYFTSNDVGNLVARWTQPIARAQ